MLDLAPLSGLVLRTPRLELRLPCDDELRTLALVAQQGVHDPGRMPFLVPWTDPSATFVEDFVAYHAAVRAQWHPENWRLELAVFRSGQPIGIQVINAEHFSACRTTGSASWLAISRQGHGYGTEMRTAILELAFRGLDAHTAVSGAFADNPASARVSAKLGYAKDGVRSPMVRGRAVHEDRFRLTRDRFDAVEHVPVTIEGVDACRFLFGVGNP